MHCSDGYVMTYNLDCNELCINALYKCNQITTKQKSYSSGNNHNYTFEKRYYGFHPITRFVCLSVSLSVCVSVIRIVTRWLDLATVLSEAITPKHK